MTSFLVLWVLSQPAPTTGSLNLNQQPIESRQGGVRIATTRQYAVNCGANMTCTVSGGQLTLSAAAGAGAPANATYITQTADATLTNEQALSANATGLMISTNGTGVVTTYAGATCGANQYATQTSSAGALTCSQVTTAQLSGTITDAQLASSYSGVGACGANTFASTLNDNAAPTCTQPSFANLSGTATTAQLPTIPVTKGGTNLTTIAANQVWTGTAADTVAAKTVPDCDDTAGQHLNFDNATQTWTCGTSGGGGGGGLTYADLVAATLGGF